MAQDRDRWARAAAAWGAQADALRRDTMPVSAWLVDALEPQPGHTVLELAAGPGDTGFLVAELIQPGGTLISSDFSPEMLTVAQQRADAQGIRNVRFRQVDMQLPLDQPAASVDGVLCRWGFQVLADPEPALREARRVLRPQGRLAMAAPAEDLSSSAVVDVLVALGRMAPPEPDAPGQFGFAREGRIAELLDAAGFDEPVVDRVDFAVREPSVESWWRSKTALSPRIADAAVGLDPEAVLPRLREVAAPHQQPDGSLALPASSWVATASA
jgi:SAM-dependent methyltransferase